MTDRSPFTRLTRIPTSVVMFLACMMILGVLLLAASGATQDASVRPSITTTTVATAAATITG